MSSGDWKLDRQFILETWRAVEINSRAILLAVINTTLQSILFACLDHSPVTHLESRLSTKPITNIMLYLVGLGLADETDITVKGLDVVKLAERVYLEAYTSILLVDKSKLVGMSMSQRDCHCKDQT